MRYGPEHNNETRERIIETAARLFREQGIASVGLATVMSAADLTVGTFYTHFKSKEALVKEMVLRAMTSRHEELVGMVDLETLIRAYLSPEHRDNPGTGCPIAALAPEVARHPRATREAFTQSLVPSLEVLTALLSAHRGTTVSPFEAMAFFGLLTGTLQLARTMTEHAQSDAILDAGIQAAFKLAACEKSGRVRKLTP